MPLPQPKSLQNFVNDFLQSWAALIGVSDVTQIPFTDPIVAIAGSNSGSALYLQSLIYQLEAFSRASTSTGADLDSWFAQFSYTDSNGVFHGFQRPQGSPASVTIQANVQIPAGQASVLIPSGTIFQTQPLTIPPASVPIVFQAETTQDIVVTSNGNTNLLCFGFAPVTYTDQSGNSVMGYAIFNNVPSGQFTQQFSPIAGLSSVTNPLSPTGGTNNASDAQARIDFVNWITSLSDGTYAALVAAIESAASGLEVGENVALYSGNPADPRSPSFVPPGLIASVTIGSGSGQYPGANPNDPTMDAVGTAIESTRAFGIPQIQFYANQYPITAATFTYTYSQAALTAAGLTVAGLQALMTGILQSLIPSGGANLGQKLYFSTLVQQWKNISVTLSGGVISNIVVDVNGSAWSITTSGGTFTSDSVQPGTPLTLDQAGYLSLATSVVPTFNAVPIP